MSDLLSRSSAHWSEAGRAGMDAFYTLATDDYRHLAEALDWRALFEEAQGRVGGRPVHLLDVACGSGKFPRALCHHCRLADAAIQPVETTLLDPSAFSIKEAREALEPPFLPAAEVETTLQAFRPPETGYDIVWATHALYAIPEDELAAALSQFLAAISPGGLGVIAHSAASGHYVRFHHHYLASSFGDPQADPYISAELIVETLRRLGASVDVQEVRYDSVASIDQSSAVEGFLQRCVFDDSVALPQMQATEPLASYLDGCRNSDAWRFGQQVWLISVSG